MSEVNTNETVNEAVNPGEAVTEVAEEKVTTEEFKVSGEAIVGKVREIIREGNIRRITIKNDEEKTLLEIPLSLGVVGGLLLPTLAAIGAIGALIANLSITVERVEGDKVVDTEEVEDTLEAASA